MTNNPLVSFSVFAYKQERFVREAVRSALAQTYEPLEILLTDDDSPDHTFEIMKEEAECYRGPHKIILNRNSHNLRIANHINRAWDLTKGEFVVFQAGDDISHPERTEKLVQLWRESGCDLVYSEFMPIDVNGAPADRSVKAYQAPPSVERAILDEACLASGCTCGYSRSLHSFFGPLDERVMTEDMVYPFRALLGHGIRFINEPLVEYRLHGGSVSDVFVGRIRKLNREEAGRWAVNRWGLADEWLRAWDRAGRPSDHYRYKLQFMADSRQLEAAGASGTRASGAKVVFRACFQRMPIRTVLGLMKRHVLRWGYD